MIRAMYAADLGEPLDERRTRHYLVRSMGARQPTSSLFVGGGHAFVTNIGTHPDARGQGLGTAATVATLALARDLGRPSATLIASIDGRGVYRRLGFREAGEMERYVATAPTMPSGQPADDGAGQARETRRQVRLAGGPVDYSCADRTGRAGCA